MSFYVGFDMGSSAIHYAIVNDSGEVVFSPPFLPHFGNPLRTLDEAWQNVSSYLGSGKIVSTAFTGTGARYFPEIFEGLLYDYESVTIPMGVGYLAPEASYVFHIGARDSLFFRLGNTGSSKTLLEWSANSKCGGGSGTLLEKQVRRLYIRELENSVLTMTQGTDPDSDRRKLEDLFRDAERDASSYKQARGYNARCGVVIQSDLIHDQNEGASRSYLMANLYTTLARNFRNDVIGSRELEPDKLAVATGGVFESDFLLERLKIFSGTRILRPDNSGNVSAIGIALQALKKNNHLVLDFFRLGEVTHFARERYKFAPPLSASLTKVHFDEGKDPPLPEGDTPDVAIGVDGGSTTTKAAVVDVQTGCLLDKIYIKTQGDPVGALRQVFSHLSERSKGYHVLGICTTGSARRLYERILVSRVRTRELKGKGFSVPDGAVDEITCHAVGAQFHDPGIDTIFEIGGQDMKFTTFKRIGENVTDEVQEARMNYSCQAGAGQTLENMARVLGLDVKSSLQELALQAPRVPIIDSTCGVFMEMDENRLVAENFTKAEVAAAIVRATAASYYNKFVGGQRHVQKKCSCQGGPPLGKAFLAAMAQVTGVDIYAYPGRELFGAWGAALVMRDRIRKLQSDGCKVCSAFRGWEVVDMSFQKKEVLCSDYFGARSCSSRNCKLMIFTIGEEQVVTGGFCPLGNSESTGSPKVDYVETFHKLLEKHFEGLSFEELEKADKKSPAIGIARSGATLGWLAVWSSALFRKLGFIPVLSPVSDQKIAQLGINNAPTEFCIAMKLAVGHFALLAKNRLVEFLFCPGFIDIKQGPGPRRVFCIYTQAEGYLLKDILGLRPSRQVLPVLHLGDEEGMARAIQSEMEKIGHSVTLKKIREALTYAEQRSQEFILELENLGDRYLEDLEAGDDIGYVGLGRDYVLLDPEASSSSGRMLTHDRGLNYIPQVFLARHYSSIPIDDLVNNEYWYHSAAILQASIFVAQHPRLYPVRQMNFACGPDSIKFYHERAIFERARKPFLHLVTDAQTNNAPFVTRVEAHERVVAKARPRRNLEISDFTLFSTKNEGQRQGNRIWLIPYMGESSRFGAALLRHFGVSSQVLPTNTTHCREWANRFITTETCFPLRVIVGDILSHLDQLTRSKGSDWVRDRCLVFLPTTSGPCREGKYGEVLKIFLSQLGYPDLPVLGPSSEEGYADFISPDTVTGLCDRSRLLMQVFNVIKIADMLDDLARRYRPYAPDKVFFDQTHSEMVFELEQFIEKRGAPVKLLRQWSERAIDIFAGMVPQKGKRFPLVLYIGEIYTRQHDPYMEYVIRRLEEEKLEVIRGPVAEWIEYANCSAYRKNPHWKHKLIDIYLAGVTHRFNGVFQGALVDRHMVPEPEELIRHIEKSGTYHGDIRGESPLVIGMFQKFMENGLDYLENAKICGIFHVAPFTCMQESVAMARIDAMLKEKLKIHPDLVVPVVHAFFGDSPNPNLNAEIAAFREQCYLKARFS